ncbi:MAG: DNA mismatch repair protein MutL, partial [Flavobacteriales bacterium]
LLQKDHYPSYFINISIDPGEIDVNIHPTKTEIKFENDKAIYAILNSAVKRAMGKYNVAPSLDFERETGFDVPPPKKGEPIKPPQVNIDPQYNPFNYKDDKNDP